MKVYQTIQGETWDLIAFRQYGGEFCTPLLLEANPQYMDMVIFPSGIRLSIPDLPEGYRQHSNGAPWRDPL